MRIFVCRAITCSLHIAVLKKYFPAVYARKSNKILNMSCFDMLNINFTQKEWNPDDLAVIPFVIWCILIFHLLPSLSGHFACFLYYFNSFMVSDAWISLDLQTPTFSLSHWRVTFSDLPASLLFVNLNNQPDAICFGGICLY